MKRRLISFILVLALCLGILPAAALAAGTTSTTTFKKVDKADLKNGQYIVVATSDKDGLVALGQTLSSSKLNGVLVTASNDIITLSNASASALLWDVDFSNSNGNVTLETSGGKYLRLNSSKNLELDSNTSNNTWTYNGDDQLTMKLSAKTYGLNYSSSSDSFSASSNGGDEPFAFYAEYTGGSEQPIEGITYQLTDSIEAGKEYIIVDCNDAGSGHAIKYSGTEDSAVSKGAVTVTKSGIDIIVTLSDDTDYVMKAEKKSSTLGLVHEDSGNSYPLRKSGNSSTLKFGDTSDSCDAVTVSSGKVVLGGKNYIKYSSSVFSTTTTESSGNAYLYEKVSGGSEEPGSQTEETVFTLTDKFELGKKYLIVNANNGSAKALANNNSDDFATENVTVSDSKVVYNGNGSSVWEAKETKSESGLIGLYNGTNVLKLNASSSPYIKTCDTSYNAGGFAYTANNHISYPYSQKDYFIGSDATNGFKASSTETSLGKVYIFVEGEGGTTGGDEPTPSGAAVYIGFTSDVHGKTDNLENWFKKLPKAIDLENMGYCGDYSYSSNEDYLKDFNKVVSLTNQYVGSGAGVYTTGNHCWSNGGTAIVNQMESTTGFKCLGNVEVDTDAYEVYCFGAYKNSYGAFQQSDITALDTYLKTVDPDTPVFILSHYPLHYISSRTITNAESVINLLNQYPNAVFMWGHNHSQGGETHYGEVKSYGDSIQYTSSASKAISFTYACAGAMNDSQGSYDGCVAGVDGTKVTFYYYNADGTAADIKNTNPKAKSLTVDISKGTAQPGEDPVVPTTGVTYEKVAKADLKNGQYIIVANNNTDGLVAMKHDLSGVKVTDKDGIIMVDSDTDLVWTADFSNGNSIVKLKTDSNYLRVSTSDGLKVSSSDNNNNWNYGDNGKMYLTVSETNYALNYSSGSSAGFNSKSKSTGEEPFTFYKKVTGGSEDPGSQTEETVFTLTDKFELGKKYLIVNANNGSAKALANNSNRFATENVTVSDSKVVYNGNGLSVWEAKETKSGSGLIGLYNGTNVLKVDASSASSPYIKTSATSYNAGGFDYTANNHISYPYGQNPKDYFIGSDDTNGFKASSTETSLGKVYIFIEGEGGDQPSVDPTPSTGDITITPPQGGETTNASLKVGDTLKIAVKNESTYSSYTFTATSSKAGVASVSPSSQEIAESETKVFTVTALKAGETEITISNNNTQYGDQYVRSTTIKLTVTEQPKKDPTPAAVSAKTGLVDNGSEQELITVSGNPQGCTMQYKLGDGEYSANIPKATDAGDYTVYWRAVGAEGYNNLEGESLKVTIAKKPEPPVDPSGDTPSTGGGGGGGSRSYSVTVSSTVNGSVTTSTEDGTVTITVVPDKGYLLETLSVVNAKGKAIEIKDLGNKQYSFKMPGSNVTISATFTKDTAPVHEFVDVKEADFFYDAAAWAVQNDITTGTDELHFSPSLGVERAQFVTFLWRAAGRPEPKGTAGSFNDVAVGSYYEKAVLWATEQGITKGTGKNMFSPYLTCDRAQIVTMIARFAGTKDKDTKSEFNDVKSTDYFAASVKWAKDNGITTGTSTNVPLFSPYRECNRGEAITFLYRWMTK